MLLKFINLILRYILFFSLFFYSFCAVSQNDPVINSLENQIANRPLKSLKKIDKLLSKKNLTTYDKAKLLEFKGEIYKKNQNIFRAIEYFNESYLLFKELNDKKHQISLLNSISSLYIVTENFPEIIENQNIIADLLENTDEKELLSSKYTSNMALMYLKAGDTKNAKSYLNKAISIATKNQNNKLLNIHYKDLSRIYIETNQLDSALFYSNKALKYSYKNKDYQLTSDLLLNKGEIYEKSEDFIAAEKQYEKAIRVLNIIGVNNASIYIKLGNFYKRVKLFDFANNYLKKAIKKTIKTGNNDKIIGLYHDLMENAILQRRPNTAFYYLMKYDSLNKINLKEEEKRNIDYINKKYNIQKEEIIYLNSKHTLKEKESELLRQKQITKKNKLIYIILLVLSGFLFLTGLLFYRFYKLKNEKQNLQLKNTVLRLQMNPHFIFNSLTAIQNTILKDDKLKSAELIAIFSKLIRQNLDFSNRKNISLNEEIDMLSNYLKTQQFRFNNSFTSHIDIDPKINCDETKIPPMLIQPFVENAIEHGLKHKDSGGKIDISIVKINDGIQITVIDNGIGLKAAKKYTNQDKGKINAIKIFQERLKIRQKKEENNFKISEITNAKKETIGTKVSFTLKN